VVLAAVFLLIGRAGPTRQQVGRWRVGVSMVVLGATGGALYATAPAWTYASFTRGLPLAISMENDVAVLTVVAAIAGAGSAAYRRKRWRLRRGGMPDIAKTLVGGFLMVRTHRPFPAETMA
jgi:hypothetical protein